MEPIQREGAGPHVVGSGASYEGEAHSPESVVHTFRGLTVGLGLSLAFWGLVILFWLAAMSLGLWAGSRLGQNSWRWNLWAVSGVIALFFIIGWAG